MNLENKYQKLFQPIKINQLEVKNRIFMSPMSTNFATKDGYVTDEMIYYYSRRAKGGVGLIVTEVTMIEQPTNILLILYQFKMIPILKDGKN